MGLFFNKGMRGRLTAVMVGAATALMTGTAVADTTIATSPEIGTYFPVGAALKLLIADTGGVDAPKVSVVATGGSVENLLGLGAGRYDLAIVQADQLADAVKGAGAFAQSGPIADLTTVMALHHEAMALVVPPGSKIKSLADLAGKRVDLGPTGSGTRQVATALTALITDKPVKPFAGRIGETNLALCDKRIDAAFMLVGHPSAGLIDALTRCKSRLVPLNGPLVDAFLTTHPQLNFTTIPGKVYPRVPKPIPTLGVHAVLVAKGDGQAAMITRLVKAATKDFAIFRMMHPALVSIAEVAALKPVGEAAPIHPAAVAAFGE